MLKTPHLMSAACIVALLAGRAFAQFDCNANGIADTLDIASGAAADCNGNGIPDSCDLAASPALTIARSFPAGASPQGLVAADFNADGRADLVVVNRDTTNLTVLLNTGGGNFTAQTTALPFAAEAVVAADFNKDGLADLATADFVNNTVTILLNTTTAGILSFGTATSLSAGANPSAIAAIDLNGDGNLDLVVANQTGNNVTRFLNSGAGVFTASGTQSVGQQPIAMATADFNGDQVPDLAVANFSSNTVSILLTGSPTVQTTPAILGAPFALAAGDFTGDGIADLAVANSGSSTITILQNNGAGVFSAGLTLNAVTNPVALAAADINGDGRLDLVAAGSNGVTIFLAQPNGQLFASRTGDLVVINSLAVADFAGTGLEIAAANETAGDVQILQDGTTPAFSQDCNGNGVPDECEPGVAGTCGNATPPPAPACGAGVCGTGAAAMAPFMLLGLAVIKSARARRMPWSRPEVRSLPGHVGRSQGR